MVRVIKSVFFGSLFLIFLVNCTALKHSPSIIAIDGNGLPVSVEGKKIKDTSTNQSLDKQYALLKDSLIGLIQTQKIDTVLLYIHGGMVGLKGPMGIKRNERILDSITSNSPSTFPLFINWDSGLLSCYKQHLFKVRQGHVLTDVEGVLSAPTVFAYDVVRSMIRIPRNVMYQGAHDFKDVEWLSWRTRNADRVKDSLLNASPKSFEVVYGNDERKIGTRLKAFSLQIPLTPIRYTAGLFFMELLGVNSWDNMKRRTTILFRPQYEFGYSYSKKSEVVLHSEPRGNVVPLFQLLKDIKAVKSTVVINLVGHSMGAIVACEAFKTFPELEIDNVVFMGAACSFDDVENAIIPALKRNENMRFYNLTLHPEAEAREITVGSLLEQIDNFYEPISDYRERTFGKYENAMCTVHIIPESLRSRVTLKSFPFQKGYPVMHDSFVHKQYKFWRPVFWE